MEQDPEGVDVESMEAINALLLTFWWYLETVDLRYDDLTAREQTKVLNYYIKHHVRIV